MHSIRFGRHFFANFAFCLGNKIILCRLCIIFLKMKRFAVSFFLVLVVMDHLIAQISIEANYTVDHLVRDVMFNGAQNISNVRYTGHPSAVGYFKGG